MSFVGRKPGQKRRLSPREIAFAENLLAGMNNTEALSKAAPELAKRWATRSITQRGSKMAADPRIREYIKTELDLRAATRRLREDQVLTRMEKRGLLARCARANNVEWSQRLTAVKVDNEMSGDAMVRVEGEVTLAVILAAIAGTTGLLRDDEQAALSAPFTKTASTPLTEALVEQEGEVLGPMADDLAAMGMNGHTPKTNGVARNGTRVYQE
jgi:hypothetical protein